MTPFGESAVGLPQQLQSTNDPATARDAGAGFIVDLGYTALSNGRGCGATGLDSIKITGPVASKKRAGITSPTYE